MGSIHDSEFYADRDFMERERARMIEALGSVATSVEWSEMVASFGYDNFSCATKHGPFDAYLHRSHPIMIVDMLYADTRFDEVIAEIEAMTTLEAIYMYDLRAGRSRFLRGGTAGLRKRFPEIADEFGPRYGCHWVRPRVKRKTKTP